jgi:tetratricopeptide (TPR) repeat protein
MEQFATCKQAATGVDRGVELARQGRLNEAIAYFRRVLEVRPDLPRVHHNLGVALAEQARLPQAQASFERAVRLRPDYAEARCNLGNTLLRLGKREEAVEQFRRALRIKPDYPDALNNLGLALTEMGRPGEAVVFLQQATRLKPSLVEAFNNLGLALADLGRFAEAQTAYKQALRLKPTFSDAMTNLASAHKEQGRLAEALAGYEMSLWYNPSSPTTHWNRALTLLQMGDYERGWPEYEWRWRRKRSRPRCFEQPRWDGSALDGRTILLYSEQGMGDVIQFVRYAKLIHRRGGKVIVECPPRLLPLFARCADIDQLVAEGEPLPAFDVQAPLMSLPGLFGTTLASVPAEVPYLSVEPQLVKHWGERLGGAPGFRVGIAWQGNPRHKWDAHRSIPLAAFAPLARVPGVRLVSLQKEHGTEQLPAFAKHFAVEDLGPGEFTDTAAAMAHLDLVITVDSAVAHLAGALGRPVWVALSTIVDWRWLLGRDDTPWYPTMRLFRQKRLGDWDEVIARIARELHPAKAGWVRSN